MRCLPEVKSCCFCITLEIGSCIIGHLEFFSGLLTILHDILLALYGPIAQSQPIIAYGFMSDFLSSAIQVVMGFALVVGVKMNKLDWVANWIWVHVGLFFFTMICYLITAMIGPYSGQVSDIQTFEFLILIYTMRNLLVYGFTIIIVNSYYERRIRA